jgi:mannose-6-phosphate isomerase-like protein (cupin superfamily)
VYDGYGGKDMKGYVGDIEEITSKNTFFRQVVYTGVHSQLVVMNLSPNEEIGMEVHPDNDQFLRIETGEGKVIIDGVESVISDGIAIVVPAGANHNVINTSSTNSMKIYTIYSPAHHKDGTVHKTKADAAADEEDHL